MKNTENHEQVIILANGDFPTRGMALALLEDADIRICCDGAADKLLQAGFRPDVIIGDMDSLSEETRREYDGILVHDRDQESNDLTKAVHYAYKLGHRDLTILGASGEREDHTLGNISLMLEYAAIVRVRIVSDKGEFFPLHSGEEVQCSAGEQFSIFSLNNQLRVSSRGLKYPLDELQLSHWYKASLNEASGDCFSLEYASDDPLIIFRAF